MRRRTIFKCFHHVSELLHCAFHRLPDKRENLRLNFAVMDTDAATRDFMPVADHIVLTAACAAGVAFEQMQIFGQGHREHML